MAEPERDLEAEALRLPSKARARLAERLLTSLETERDADSEALWLEEAERRLNEIESGEVAPVSAQYALQQSRSSLR
jgi:hypothetical protein